MKANPKGLNGAEVITKARELLNDTIYPYMKDANYDQTPKATLLTFCAKQTMAIEQLADIAEKRGAIAVRKQASILAWMAGDGEADIPLFVEIAAKDLGLEESQWRKIGPEEVEDLAFVHRHIEKNIIGNVGDNDLNQKWIRAANGLRRLITEEG